MLQLAVKNREGQVLGAASGKNEVWLVYKAEYREGDKLVLSTGERGRHVFLSLDNGATPALVYCKEEGCVYPVPFGEAGKVSAPQAFMGERHYLYARLARPEEFCARRCLSQNPWATHEPGGPFPYASANVETRGEMVFAAKNAIDGLKANDFHGEWPYTSWGINRDPNAVWHLDFGRTVELDEAIFTLRADFPHDAWWKQATLCFSDQTSLTVPLEKSGNPQSVAFPPKKVEWVELRSLIKAEDPSPFPALTQLELWGREACN